MQIHPGQQKKSQSIPNPGETSPGDRSNGMTFKTLLAQELSSQSSSENSNGPDSKSGLIRLGKVTQNVPTVSELIYKTDHKEACWNILAKQVNGDKAFTSIAPETEIFLNPETSELSWGDKGEEENVVSTGNEKRPDTRMEDKTLPLTSESVNEAAATLSNAARKYIGTAYSKMDCYELVVGGLKTMGIQYQGKGGLGKHLMEKAVNKGFSYNHYLNGEGILEATGSNPYKRKVFKIDNADVEADKAMAEMAPFLRDGQILSFSTRTRGHTGIVSKKNNVWTFINSGKMDHNLAGANGKMGVGEEQLKAEVKNWFRLAGKRREGLTLSLGAVDMGKLAKFSLKKGEGTEKV
ncbi:hypothetical protein HRM2_18080 [Desulforapulum autotrophicum HRM2]|uniref:Uncharacterized protein n=2 Tax=Desulforapulum autotrophicum TaxID=2296 RepID=C0QBP8_DESAH|nr:hypothetical protein HRM2_18080 [Desulforapulum autotrophicum HRM2]